MIIYNNDNIEVKYKMRFQRQRKKNVNKNQTFKSSSIHLIISTLKAQQPPVNIFFAQIYQSKYGTWKKCQIHLRPLVIGFLLQFVFIFFLENKSKKFQKPCDIIKLNGGIGLYICRFSFYLD